MSEWDHVWKINTLAPHMLSPDMLTDYYHFYIIVIERQNKYFDITLGDFFLL